MLRVLMLLVMFATSITNVGAWGIDLPDLPTIPGVPSPGQVIGSVATLGRFRVSIKNETAYPISVCWHRLVKEFDYQGDPGKLRWRSEGWWNLAPFEEAYIGTTEGRNVYFHAVAQGGRLTWGGNVYQNVNGRQVGMFHVDMGHTFSYFTQRFTR